jgi:tetratricopeptide (TPR) repeat protein
MADENAEYWKNKGDEFFKTQNFEETIKCYEKAASLNLDDGDVFKRWGDALADLAKIKQDETLYWEAFAKFKEATEKDPNNADTLTFWGYALADLGKMKQDETLYWEAFAKFKEAAEKDPNNADTLTFWGYALAGLAGIKQDETLYQEAFVKYKEAAEKDPSNANTLSFWGNALAELAAIKQDETLYQEAFVKFKEAAEKNPDDAITFRCWGNVLADLAKIRQDETLYQEAFVKYKEAAEKDPNDAIFFNNWGIALAKLAEITQDTEVIKALFEEFYQKSDSLKKLKKDILGICIIFNKKNMKEIIDDKRIFFPLLERNLENDDSKFFYKIIKDIPDEEKKLEKYKRAYILSVLIISQLHVNNKNEQLVAYYTKKTVSQEMLFNDKAFRLNAINYSNDPTEGKILLDYLFGEGKYPLKELNIGYGAFAGCFTFNHDSLNQFRLYGKAKNREGTGLSLVFKDTFFSKKAKMAMRQDNLSVEDKQHALFRCIYIDPMTRRVETVGHKEAYLFYRENNKGNTDKDIEKKIKNYDGYITDIITNVKREMEDLKKLVEGLKPEVIGQLLINLRYLTKHIAFKEEQECRIIKIHPLNDKETVKINPEPDEEKNIQVDKIKQLYIDYQTIIGHIEKIYFGPNASQMELFQDLLRYKGQNIPCEKSRNPLA